MGAQSGKKRVDSMMVSSSCRRMTRLSLMHLAIRAMFERIIESGGAELPDIACKYVKNQQSGDICYRLGKDEIMPKMEEALSDALSLASAIGSSYAGTDEYRRLMRMIEDQSKESPGGRVLKENGEILPTSMQSLSDEDATYRKKGGTGHVGYALNLEESCSENGNLVTDYDLQPNTYTDIQFSKDTLNALPDENDTELIATDGAYASAELLEEAERKGVTLAATTLVGGVQDNFEAMFEISEDNVIIRCPAGHEPMKSRYNEKSEKYTAHFKTDICESCPHCSRCPGKFQKKKRIDRVQQDGADACRVF
jgi:hypothetical protein